MLSCVCLLSYPGQQMNSGKWAQMSLESDWSWYYPPWRMKSEAISTHRSSHLNSTHDTASHIPSAGTKPQGRLLPRRCKHSVSKTGMCLRQFPQAIIQSRDLDMGPPPSIPLTFVPIFLVKLPPAPQPLDSQVYTMWPAPPQQLTGLEWEQDKGPNP